MKRQENAFAFGGGDWFDSISRDDKRHVESVYAPWMLGANDPIKAQIDRGLDLWSPIHHKLLCLLSGNHEKHMLRVYERDIYSDFSERLFGKKHVAQRQMGTCGFLNLVFRRGKKDSKKNGKYPTWTLTFWLHHGYGGSKLKGGKALNLERILLHFDADIILHGHVHDAMLTVREIRDALEVSWQTAKYVSREVSQIVRTMRKGTKLIWWPEEYHLGSVSGRCVSGQVVELIDDLFGLEWRAEQLVETATLT